jgi:hypothetical protein
MSAVQTRPIPFEAVEVLQTRHLSDMGWSRACRTPNEIASSATHAIDWTAPSDKRPLRRHAQEVVAAAALALLAHHAYASPGVGDFLAVVGDKGISRPMLDIGQFKVVRSRAAASMEPWELSDAAAMAVRQTLAAGAARPTFKIRALPEYNG